MEEKSRSDIKFYCGNPDIEESEGIIHLYKNESRHGENDLLTVGSLPLNRTTLICVLAVPSYMSPSDFAGFTGAYHKNILNMRIIRDSNPLKYMVLVKFTDQDSADEFFLQFNGKQFNSMESETCSVVFVSTVEFIKPDHGTSTSSQPLFPPTGQIELPTCPVCLERLDDSVSGVLTILCNHSFHCQCLSKWKGDNSCPICRYCQQPDSQSPVCSTCFTTESLWICLVCGNVGCGRYVNEHARLHYNETHHPYALELQTARVWDYAGDGYVHRLIQNKSDGKLVELPPPPEREVEITNSDHLSKIESISLEYNYLLDTQKKYFDEQLRKIERDKMRKITHLEEEYAQLLDQKVKTDRKIREYESDKTKHLKKVQTFEKLLKDMQDEKDFLSQVNEALKGNQQVWQEKIKEAEKKASDDTKDKKISELEDQIRDLMFFIEAKQKIENHSENDLKDGSLRVVVPSPKKTPTNHRKKNSKS